jgi:hypothetical protein
MPSKKRKNKIRLLPHEVELVEFGSLQNVTHVNASSIWLRADSLSNVPENYELCYRHMGDTELLHLLSTNQLPATQPYQTLTRGSLDGREYCESYLLTNKYVDTYPSTVVEFLCPRKLVDSFFATQRKPEDGTLSNGMGNKAGRSLVRFNEALANGSIQGRIVFVRRSEESLNSFVQSQKVRQCRT